MTDSRPSPKRTMRDADACAQCDGKGYVDCLCGGDTCVCGNNGEALCPMCGGARNNNFDEDDSP